MVTNNQSDSLHKAKMYLILDAITDDIDLAKVLAFKGGTCASMLRYLDRFSVDLDFDLLDSDKKKVFREKLIKIFKELDLEVKDQSKQALQFFLKYKNKANERSNIKIEITDNMYSANKYEKKYFEDLNKFIQCQTIGTMFGNKLVAITDRYKLHGSIAARDLYDIHHFFTSGYSYDGDIIIERTGLDLKNYFDFLKKFITEKITQEIIDQDLNGLLNYEVFHKLRKSLKKEVIIIIQEEIKKYL